MGTLHPRGSLTRTSGHPEYLPTGDSSCALGVLEGAESCPEDRAHPSDVGGKTQRSSKNPRVKKGQSRLTPALYRLRMLTLVEGGVGDGPEAGDRVQSPPS